MKSSVQYLVDDNGNATSVVVPLRQWERLNKQRKQLEKKLQVFMSIRQGIAEVKQASRNGRKLQSLTDFLNEK